MIRRCDQLIKHATNVKDTEFTWNLTAQEIKGKESLQKRVKRGEIVIFPTDKSGKLVVSTPSTYLEAAREHTGKDQEVYWSRLETTEREVNRHCTALRIVF